MKNRTQLITYVNRLGGGGLRELHALLKGSLGGLFGGVHLLPFFHPIDGADAGFDPIDHTQVDSRLGSWDDVAALTRDIDVMADVIVNHISSRSPQFLDFSTYGSASNHAALFLTRETVFPHGAREADLRAIYRPRQELPFTRVTLRNGEERVLWTTFTPQQIDIDVTHPQGIAYLECILATFAAAGIRMVRLDAAGHAIKKAGTSCFMLPETLEFIEDFAARAQRLGMEVLVEIHSHYRRQIEIAARVDWVYDFALPPLVLHAFAFCTAQRLKEWIRIRPNNAVTVLDTHDGIGVIDIGADVSDDADRTGLVPPEQIDQLVQFIHHNSGGQSRLATGAEASNIDAYQVNCTYYDALGRNDRAYLAARAIQFFLPGVPQVYYVGLLAGGNDTLLLKRTGVGRDINRHYYNEEEVREALERPVVRQLCELIRLRNSHPAFGGEFTLVPTGNDTLRLRWSRGVEFAQLDVRFEDASLDLSHSPLTGDAPSESPAGTVA